MRQSIVRITTHDTKKTYEYGADVDDAGRPQVWEATLKLKCVDVNGRTDQYGKSATVYLERSTLERHKLVPQPKDAKPQPEPTETPEDLLLRLLEVVGVYPEG